MYAPNTRAPKFIKETFLQPTSHVDPHVVIGSDVNTLTVPIGRSSRQKLSRKMLE